MKIFSDHPNALELVEYFERWLAVVPPHWREILGKVHIHLTSMRLDEMPVTREAATAEQAALAEQMKKAGTWKPDMDVMCCRASKRGSDGHHVIYQMIQEEDVNEDTLSHIATEVLTCIGKVAFSIVNTRAKVLVEQDPQVTRWHGSLSETARRDLFGVFFMLVCFPKLPTGRHHRKRMRLVHRVDQIVRETVECELSFAE